MHQHHNWKPGHAEQNLGQPSDGTAIHPLAAFLVDAATVAVGVGLAQKDKVPVAIRWVGGGIALIGVIRAFTVLAEVR